MKRQRRKNDVGFKTRKNDPPPKERKQTRVIICNNQGNGKKKQKNSGEIPYTRQDKGPYIQLPAGAVANSHVRSLVFVCVEARGRGKRKVRNQEETQKV